MRRCCWSCLPTLCIPSHERVFFFLLVASRSCFRNRNDFSPIANLIACNESFACHSQSATSFSMRLCRPSFTHRSYPIVEGSNTDFFSVSCTISKVIVGRGNEKEKGASGISMPSSAISFHSVSIHPSSISSLEGWMSSTAPVGKYFSACS